MTGEHVLSLGPAPVCICTLADTVTPGGVDTVDLGCGGLSHGTSLRSPHPKSVLYTTYDTPSQCDHWLVHNSRNHLNQSVIIDPMYCSQNTIFEFNPLSCILLYYRVSHKSQWSLHFVVKLRERKGHRVDSGRSLKGHL